MAVEAMKRQILYNTQKRSQTPGVEGSRPNANRKRRSINVSESMIVGEKH